MNLLNIIFPRRCLGCGKIGKYFCTKCSSAILTIKQNELICPICTRPAISGITHPICQTKYTLDGLTSFFRYTGIVRQAIKAIKYRYISDLTQEFIDLLPKDALNNLTNPYILDPNSCCLVPIPLHPSRFRFRGFNQAEVLGKLLAKRLNIPIKTDVLKRVKKTTPQVEMRDRKKRLENMDGVFSVSPNILISQYPDIFLFDDVFTTGATLRSAANVLKRAGVRKVWGIVMAHG